MNLITIEQARTQCKLAEGEDDAILTIYANAAEAACTRAANRSLFATPEALQTAIDGVPTAMAAAHVAYDAAIDAANLLADSRDADVAKVAAWRALADAKISTTNTLNGMVVTDDVIGAILITVGHFYRYRDEAECSLPGAARNVMDTVRYCGECV